MLVKLSPFSVTWSMFLFLFKTLYECNPSSLVEVKQRYCNTSQANKHNVRVFTTHDMQRRMKFIQHYAAANHKWDYRSISLKSHLWYQSQHFSVCLQCGICVVSMGNYVTLAHQLLLRLAITVSVGMLICNDPAHDECCRPATASVKFVLYGE